MDTLNIKQFSNLSEAAEAAGQALNKLLADNLNSPVLLMLSAGSAFGILKEVAPETLTPNLTVTMLDERFSLDEKINNFSQFQKTRFYNLAHDGECSFIGTAARPKERIEEFCSRWEKKLRDWKKGNPDGKILATFGMGPDGHLAGIFPFPEDPKKFEQLFLGNNWLACYFALGKHLYPERVTTTPAFFKLLDGAVAYICGSEKQPAFQELLDKTQTIAELPAMALYEIKNLEVYTDLK